MTKAIGLAIAAASATVFSQSTFANLKEATDADIQKANGEINAIQTAIIGLDNEMKEQERTLQMVQATTEEEELRKMAIEEQKEKERHRKGFEQKVKEIEKAKKQKDQNPTDTSNPLWYEDGSGFIALQKKMAENDKKGDFSGKGLSLPGAGGQEKKPSKIPLSALGCYEDTSDEMLRQIQNEYKDMNIIIIDDREKFKD